jgi:hypothetical protein
MTTATETQITGAFNWILPEPEVIASLVQGEDTQQIYEIVRNTFPDNVWYNPQTNTMKGSNPFIAAKVDSLVRPLGIRVANLRDFFRPEVLDLIENRFYSDTPSIVLRSNDDSYERNIPLIRRITELVEEKEGRVNMPLMITGFDVEKWPEDEKGYGLTIVPRDDFSVISDKRLGGEYNIKKFSTIDNLALPNFDRKGSRTWYAKDQGLSRLYLVRNLALDSGDDSLANSSDSGRVVLVKGGEATSQNFEAQLRQKYNSQRKALDSWLKDSLDKIPGGNK